MEKLDQLARLIAQNTDGDGVFETAIPRLSVIRMSKPTEPLHAIHQPAVCIIAQGAKQVMLADEIFRYSPGQYLVVSVDMPVTGQVIEANQDKPYLCLRLNLDLKLLSEMLVDMPAVPGLPSIRKKCIGLSHTTPEFLDAALRLAQLLDKPDEIAYLAPLIERELMFRLLRGDQAEMIRQILAPENRLQQVNRAISWIRQNFSAPFSIEQVAVEARMSTSSLHQHFREVTAMSPLQYQKQLRLQEARRLILGKAMDAATAAHQVGYDSPSQFSREYRRLFGAPPIQDITRLRSEPARYAEA
ncbi:MULTISPECIES: AraC family transcriptional regulator [unclassified Neorhizobium]|uniref:AraC family transcriptional regulator n=1 Tax=unclassified Neorhizobium TaxID=2629175 RepID=UPI001FF2043C|nr:MULTISPECIES: AraC family transcriptional regulator [unclassified Neorhizobium]MCJ9671927.1 AraC family transcriptional regulator [Neorhizobium sp. SHOUNA12B]MCJ9746466.1 AraC family transcriptional regulator [Neorhizobium sp. SHOUNA12A]